VTLAHLYRIGKKARAWAERTAKKEHFGSELSGLCARSAVQLYTLLSQNSIEATIVYNRAHFHFFVLVEGYVIDVTATQFLNTYDKPVLVLPTEETSQYPQYTIDLVFPAPQKVAFYQKRTHWPTNQISNNGDSYE